MNEFKRVSGTGLDQGAAQVSAGNTQSAFVEVHPLQIRVNREDGLDIAPFEGSFGTDDPFKDVVRVLAFRLVEIFKYT